MDSKTFREKWEELKQYESFYRVQSASDVLSILSYKWSQVGGEPEVGQTIWEGVNDASHAMTKIIMEHVPSQEQDRAFGALADFINYTFVISAHERHRKEAKEHGKRVLDATAQAAAHARRGLERVNRIKRQVIKEIAEQVWERNATLNGNIRGTATKILDKINPLIAERCEQEGLEKPKEIKLDAAMAWVRKVLTDTE